MTASGTLRRAAVVLAIAASLVGCGNRDEATAPPSPAARGPALLNDVSTADLLDAFIKAELPVVNAHDVTDATCPQAGCLEARDTDTVKILKFPSTGRAELYAGAVPDMLQVEDVVLVFDKTVNDAQKAGYAQVVKDSMAER